MNKLIMFAALCLPITALAADSRHFSANSPETRTAVLELYTSEGCSSCPPADHFLSALKDAGISDQQLIPMAFHVTYWDYIGWKDRFAKKQYDLRQREMAKRHDSKTVYTPQFLLVGEDYRRYATFSEDINKLAKQKAAIELMLAVNLHSNTSEVKNAVFELTSTAVKKPVKNVSLYFAVIENELLSEVNDGENHGKTLRHDYVVRHLSSPFEYKDITEPVKTEHSIVLKADWKQQDLSIVAFAQDSRTGEVLQAVRLKL